MVYKPSEFTPLHGQTLAEIYTEAGVPPVSSMSSMEEETSEPT